MSSQGYIVEFKPLRNFIKNQSKYEKSITSLSSFQNDSVFNSSDG